MADSSTVVDIVVVGAGIIGCAVGFELSRRGASVQIVDERPAGMGATQASAGVLAPYIEAREGSPLLDLAVRSLAMYDAFVAQVGSASAMPIAYRRTGTIEVALQEDAMTALRRCASLLERRGVRAGLLDAAAARAEEPRLSAGVVGGLFVAEHGYVGALELTRGLAIAARRLGAQLVEGGRVRRIARKGSDLMVETERGSLIANVVVLAAGSWTGQIEIDGVRVHPMVKPVRGQLLHLAWHGPPLRRVTWGERCYLVPWEDGTLLVGATVEDAGFDEGTTLAGVHDLIEAACELVPHAWTAGLVAAKAGLRPATRDELPIVGRSEVLPNLVYATGHYRNGVLLAPLTAHLVAELVLEQRRDPALDAVSPQRFGIL